MQDNKLKDTVYFYRWALFGFLILTLMVVSFYGGVSYSCQDGIRSGFKCIDPQKVATVSVCEYNPLTCASNCASFMVNDVNLFCEEYSKNGFI